jgi:hypothetical protein
MQSKGNGMTRPAHHLPRSILLCVAFVMLVAIATTAQAAQPSVGLGTADSFAVLGASTVTNTGPSVINGDLGLSPGTSITGFPPGTVNGTVHAANAVAGQAQSDLTTAYNDAAGRTPALVVPGDIGGLFLTPGVYKRSSSLLLTGDATLDAQGNPDAVFIFQIGSTLTTASNSRVLLTGGAQACNVFWQVGSSATLGTNTSFRGTILALASITVTTRTDIVGRALARTAAVTLDTNTITRATCAPGTTPGGGTPPGGTPPGGGTPGSATPTQNGATFVTTTPRSVARTVTRFGTSVCVDNGFRAVVGGQFIRTVTFRLDGRIVKTVRRAPFQLLIRKPGGIHRLSARVVFTDGTPARTINFRFRICEPAVRALPPVTG